MSGENSGGMGNSECAGGGNPDGEEGEGHQGPGGGSWQHRGGNQQESGRGRARVGDGCVEVAARWDSLKVTHHSDSCDWMLKTKTFPMCVTQGGEATTFLPTCKAAALPQAAHLPWQAGGDCEQHYCDYQHFYLDNWRFINYRVQSMVWDLIPALSLAHHQAAEDDHLLCNSPPCSLQCSL